MNKFLLIFLKLLLELEPLHHRLLWYIVHFEFQAVNRHYHHRLPYIVLYYLFLVSLINKVIINLYIQVNIRYLFYFVLKMATLAIYKKNITITAKKKMYVIFVMKFCDKKKQKEFQVDFKNKQTNISWLFLIAIPLRTRVIRCLYRIRLCVWFHFH